ncbi:MAG: HAMP domain-containing protein [Verrucomicrobia bacterium]|nr:HAMP domain-containing protein [Verrucomicrobiota bacterium]
MRTLVRSSLTAKTLLAVGLTVAVVIAIYTYFVIRVQSTWWHERTLAQNALTTSLVHEYMQDVMLSGRHSEAQRFLVDLKNSHEIVHGRIIDAGGRVVFSDNPPEVGLTTLQTPPTLFTGDHILHSTRDERGQRLAVTMRPVRNDAKCEKCHGKDEAYLGAIVLEKSMAPAEAAIAENRNLLIVYGGVIFVLVSIVLWVLIVRFVTQPVSELLYRMRRVQGGDLTVRVRPAGLDEINELARGFDSMVDSLADAQRELEASHEKQIQQASKLATIGELAAGIAHEIRNPLAGISAAVDVLSEFSDSTGQYAEVVREIHQQIARLNSTLRSLLDFARPREPEIVPCDVCELMGPMLTLVRPDAQKHHIQIIENCSHNLPPICVDGQQVQQAVLNVLLNAIQAMPDGGTLTVSAAQIEWPPLEGPPLAADKKAGREILKPRLAVRLAIRDTGVGIPSEYMERIFSPFFTTKHRGTGLGLSITRTIVEKHGGNIFVTSEPGKGTEFVMEFLVCKEDMCEVKCKDTARPRPAGTDEAPATRLKKRG